MKLNLKIEYVRKALSAPFLVVAITVLIFTVFIFFVYAFSPKQLGGTVTQELITNQVSNSAPEPSAPLVSLGTNTGPGTDKDQIRQSFESYRMAALSQDGETAVQFLNDSTVQYYEIILHKIIYSDESDLRKELMGTRLAVLLTRHIATRDEILSLKSGRNFIVFSINNGLTGESGLVKIKLGDIHVSEGEAFASLLEDPGHNEKLHFVHENGTWKIDLVHTIRSSDSQLQQLASSLSMSEEEFINYVLVFKNGQEPNQNIWQPLL